MRAGYKIPSILALGWLLTTSMVLAQQQPKLRPLRIALPSNTIGATHFYVGKSLEIYESYGFDPQILVLEPRSPGRVIDRRSRFLHCHGNHDAGGAPGSAGANHYGGAEPSRSYARCQQRDYQRGAT